MMAMIHSLKCSVPFSFAVPLLSLAVTHCHSLSLFVTHFHSLSLVVPLVVTRRHSLSLGAICCTLVVTRCHSLSLVLPLVVIRFHSLYHWLSFAVTRCTTCCHSWSLVVIRCTTCLSFHKRSNQVLRKPACTW